MGASRDFTASPVHAHINLLGWVSMALYGLFYRILPQAAHGWMPQAHFWIALVGLIVGPSLTLLAMALFAVIVFTATGARTTTA